MATRDEIPESAPFLGLPRYSETEEPPAVNLDEPPPYRDAPDEGHHSKDLPPLPSYQDVAAADSRKTLIQNAIVSLITVLLCFFVIFGVLLHFLRVEDTPTIYKNIQQPPITGPTESKPEWWNLNFVKDYPPLDERQTSIECRQAWNNLTAVPCKSVIFNGNWDHGNFDPLDLSIEQVVPLVCTEKCIAALLAAQRTVGTACAGQGAFDRQGWRGNISPTLLAKAPAEEIDKLVARTQQMCRTSPTGDAERGFCMTDLHLRWDIIDGYLSDGIKGRISFMNATAISRTEPAGQHKGTLSHASWSEDYDYFREERKFGPGRGSTTCSWCTYEWFEEKLGLWSKENEAQNKGVPLPQFLRDWQSAGKRCEGSRFFEIFDSAVQSYKNAGLLEDLWDNVPSGDVPYLVAHGPSRGDPPVSVIKDIIPKVKEHLNSYILDTAKPVFEHAALLQEYTLCLEAFASVAQDLPCYPFLEFDGIKEHILSSTQIAEAVCSETCFSAINTLQSKIWQSCPAARFGRWDAYDKALPGNVKLRLGFSLTSYFGDHGTLVTYQDSCRRATGREGIPCGAIYAKWGMEEWIFSEHKPQPQELIRLTRQQLKALPRMPVELKRIIQGLPTHLPITDQDRQDQVELAEWNSMMEEGICSDCIWRQYVPYGIMFDDLPIRFKIPDVALGEEVAMEWIKTVHMMHDECEARGMQFVASEVSRVNVTWLK